MSYYFFAPKRVMMRRFWSYAIPSIMAMLVAGAYYLIDGIFVGHYIGAPGLAGINLVYPAIMILVGLAAMISMGAATTISFEQGAKRIHKARKALVNSLWLMLLFGAMAPFILYYFHRDILLVLNIVPETETWKQASDYLLWIGGGTFLLSTNLAVPYLLRNDDRPKLAMVLVSIGAILNIILNYVMVVHIGLGLIGTAQATLIAEGIVSMIGLGYFFSPYAKLRLSFKDMIPSLPAIPNLLFTGLPSLISQFNLGLLLMLHNSQIIAYGGIKDIAGFTVAGYTEAIFIIIVQGLAYGIQPLISQAAGANRYKDVMYLMGTGLKLTIFFGVLVWGGIQIFPSQVATLYIGDDDYVLLASAINSLVLNLSAIPLEGLIVFGIVVLQSMARPRQALIISLAKTILLIPFIYLLPYWLDLDGVLLAQPATILVLTIPLCWLLWAEWYRLKVLATKELSLY